MEAPFYCPECGADHNDPAEARLGHLVICQHCALLIEVTSAWDESAIVTISLAA